MVRSIQNSFHAMECSKWVSEPQPMGLIKACFFVSKVLLHNYYIYTFVNVLSVTAFALQQQNQAVAVETICSRSLKYYLAFLKTFVHLCAKRAGYSLNSIKRPRKDQRKAEFLFGQFCGIRIGLTFYEKRLEIFCSLV